MPRSLGFKLFTSYDITDYEIDIGDASQYSAICTAFSQGITRDILENKKTDFTVEIEPVLPEKVIVERQQVQEAQKFVYEA